MVFTYESVVFRKYTMGYLGVINITFTDCSQLVQKKTADNKENAKKC